LAYFARTQGHMIPAGTEFWELDAADKLTRLELPDG
jgi:hypothetical protein